jgi:transposase
MKVTRVGLDLAKRVFQVHGVNRATVCKKLSRGEVLQFFAQLPPCVVGIEACGGAHYWAWELGKLGHTVRLMAAQFVNPYRKSGKNDAGAICEAVGRPNMRFVSVKSEERQAVLMMHRARTLTVAIVAGRFITGVLLDHVFAPYIAAIFSAAALGSVGLALAGPLTIGS